MLAAPARADGDEPARPAITRHGWQVGLTGYVQADSIAWSDASIDEVDANGAPLNETRFFIRRGRLRAEARRDSLSGSIEVDGNTVAGANARLLSAQVGWSLVRKIGDRKVPLLTVTAGLLKTPFGVEVPASERDKAFLEAPAWARAMFPGNYDGGVVAKGAYGLARWSIGLMNGAPVGDRQWRGLDPASSYDVVGRVGAVVDGPYRSRVEAGVSAITGSGLHPGSPATKDDFQWIDENQNGIVESTELMVVPGRPATPSETYARDAIGFDAQLHWCLCVIGTGTVFVEGALATNLDRSILYADPVAQGRELRELGFAVGVVQSFGPHVQGGVRYDRYDADRDAFEQEGVVVVGVDQVFSTLSVMVTGRWHDARVVAQYDHERNPFGRADDGMPVTRAADRVSLRAQVGF